MLNAVGAGQEPHHLDRFEAGGPRINRVGADVADNVGAEREYPAVRIERQFCVDDFIEGLVAGREVLQAVAGPFDRAPQLPRRGASENFFRIERALAAEAAPHIRRDHADPMARNIERRRQRVAHDARHLGGRMKRQRLAARFIFGKTGARLDREHGLAVHAEAAFDAHRRGLRGGVDVAALELAADQHVAAGFFMQQRRAGTRGRLRVADCSQRLVVDGDKLEGVLGVVAALGDDADHRLADIAYLVLRERKKRRR